MGKNKNSQANLKKSNTNENSERKAIDDIFSTINSKKISKEETKGKVESKKKNEKKDGKKKAPLKKKFIVNNEKSERRTDEGYKIYTYDELNIGKGGGTKLCPFDCDCCF